MSWTGSEFAFDPLCSLLQDSSNSVRYAAAQAVGRLGDQRSFAALTNCLSNADFALRIAAVKGLHALGQPVRAEWLRGGPNDMFKL
ncbi:MAG: HEAT repeat domain-containing protein [Verrucomicrobia bacterium]|nr:HEAT repeat domain-containing protein [Verrucomicrobiota bacterium]